MKAFDNSIEILSKKFDSKRVDLIVFDFDGVFTDNRVWVDESGKEMVACHRGDGLGISMMHKKGIKMIVLSSEENPVVAARCKKLKIDCYQGISDKALYLQKLVNEWSVSQDYVIYVGNDLNDSKCMKMVGCSIAVADAYPEILHAADIILQSKGGYGAVRELCDLILKFKEEEING